MSEPLHQDDPRLTAYALGELDAAGVEEVERWLAENPEVLAEALSEISDVREFSSQLQSAFQQEPAAAIPSVQPLVLAAASAQTNGLHKAAGAGGKRAPFSWRSITISTSACLLLLAGTAGISWKLTHPSKQNQALNATSGRSSTPGQGEELATLEPTTPKGIDGILAAVPVDESEGVEREKLVQLGQSVENKEAGKEAGGDKSYSLGAGLKGDVDGDGKPESQVRRIKELNKESQGNAEKGPVVGLVEDSDLAPGIASKDDKHRNDDQKMLKGKQLAGKGSVESGGSPKGQSGDPSDDYSANEKGQGGGSTAPGPGGPTTSPQTRSITADPKAERANSDVDKLETSLEKKKKTASESGKPAAPNYGVVTGLAPPESNGDATAPQGEASQPGGKPSNGKPSDGKSNDQAPNDRQPAESKPDTRDREVVNRVNRMSVAVPKENQKSGQANEKGESYYEKDADGSGVAPTDESRTKLQTELARKGESKELEDEVQLEQLARSTRGLQTDGYRFRRHSGEGYQAESYEPLTEQVFQLTGSAPLSTFALDVDTASYTNVRRFLRNGQWPPQGAVRVEELVNFFSYSDSPPADGKPFAVRLELAACPWKVEHQLLRIGVRARDIPREQRRANLVFLLDVSGSMADANKLTLVKEAMKILTQRMTENDRVAIVTYSDTASVALESTTGSNRDQIVRVIDSLAAAGSTNGAGGIQLAYRLAAQNFIKEGTNRVLLCTDGDFNVGISDDNELVKLISEKALSGVFLSVFGFGMGNLKDAKLEKLADKGNGHYGYVDGIDEAQRLFVEQLDGTLYTVAKDVKTQVEFNPDLVASYRLIGYENRALTAEQFRDDAKDAGEIGSGHSVTVLYEIVPGKAVTIIDELKPKAESKEVATAQPAVKAVFAPGELFHVRMRYKQPAGDVAQEELHRYVAPEGKTKPSIDLQWSASVAAFGMILRNSPHKGQASLAMVQELAVASAAEPVQKEIEQQTAGTPRVSRRKEFLELVALARQIQTPVPAPVATNPPQPLGEKEALAKAAVNGKYKRLLEKLNVPNDFASYGEFSEFGSWNGTSYAGQDRLPAGYWVYVYPNWYIWGDVSADPTDAPKK